ncbi:MAG: adenylosuccinate lyase [Deltaproteobacteria bacterium]|nr:adenylosuccinate lyase [Deltaproteobacteria bacterium]
MIERYSRPDMTRLWGDRVRYETWLEVELAVCRAMESAQVVPTGTADAVRLSVQLDPERILQIEQEVRHDVIAFLTHVEEQAGAPARWLHLGMTSSDVLDTAFALQLTQAARILLGRIDRLAEALRKQALAHKRTPCVGRTHGIHAEPTTLGLAFAGFYAELQRNRRRLKEAARDLRVGKIAGAVGVYGNVSPTIERQALASLGLQPETCATQVVARDRHGAFFQALAMVASGIERFALQMRHWQRTEVSEVFEPFGGGQKGSSAMPHKRNPILTENLCGLARLIRSHAQAAMENIALWHERDISHSSVERVIAPDATILLDFMLYRATQVADGLQVDAERAMKNLQATGGLIFSEAVLLALVRRGLPRQQAYVYVQRNAMAAAAGKGGFFDLLAADQDIRAALKPDELAACQDLDEHLQHVDEIFGRVFAKDGGDDEQD